MSEVHGISITTNDPNPGDQVHGIVFSDPVPGKVFKRGHVVGVHHDGTTYDPTNDDGELPHQERTSDDEDLGLTWQFTK